MQKNKRYVGKDVAGYLKSMREKKNSRRSLLVSFRGNKKERIFGFFFCENETRKR